MSYDVGDILPGTVVKLHILLTVLLTQCAALFWDRAVPYFPIEVSRTAAAGPRALAFFRVGMLSLGMTLWSCGLLRAPYIAGWLSLIAIALFDDVHYRVLHSLSVAALGCSALAMLSHSTQWGHDVYYMSMAGTLHLLRWASKLAAMLIFEPWPHRSIPLITALVKKVMRLHDAILYRGHPASAGTLFVFRCCGVLQWVVFYLLSATLHA